MATMQIPFGGISGNAAGTIEPETWTDRGGQVIVIAPRRLAPAQWEMRRDGAWIGAADYHDTLVRKLARGGFARTA